MQLPSPMGSEVEIDGRKLAPLLMKVFSLWEIDVQQQLGALGLPLTQRSRLSRYRHGAAIPANRDSIERVLRLLAIHRDLTTLFPENTDLAYQWIKTRNRAFNMLTPIEVICDLGFAGLLMVSKYLSDQVGK